MKIVIALGLLVLLVAAGVAVQEWYLKLVVSVLLVYCWADLIRGVLQAVEKEARKWQPGKRVAASIEAASAATLIVSTLGTILFTSAIWVIWTV